MNIGLVTSFIVGGLLLLSVLFFNVSLQNKSQENTLATTTNETLNDLVTLISHDINRMGYQVTSSVIKTMDSNKIAFLGDIYDNDSMDTTRVTWEWKNNSFGEVSSTPNPNDYYLVRTGPTSDGNAAGEIQFPVTYFNVNYRNGQGVATSNEYLVREIEIEIMLESGESYSVTSRGDGDRRYYRTVWKRSFFPTNLNKVLY